YCLRIYYFILAVIFRMSNFLRIYSHTVKENPFSLQFLCLSCGMTSMKSLVSHIIHRSKNGGTLHALT
ncbi:hypothetical protein L9F63_010978, partial [Diploptera punctata]